MTIDSGSYQTERAGPFDSPLRYPPTRVVKLGGSLLSDSACVQWWDRWFTGQAACATLVVTGGGVLADAVRSLDKRYRLPAEVAHDMAIRAMQLNAFIFAQLLTHCHWIERLADWPRQVAGDPSRPGILDPVPFVRRVSTASGSDLPIGWHVTSDSIAAGVAGVVGATELVLLKSTLPAAASEPLELAQAVARGLVDEHFRVAAQHLPRIRVVNLRDRDFAERYLAAHDAPPSGPTYHPENLAR